MSQRILTTGNPIAIDRPQNHFPKNIFNLSHRARFSCNIGQLVPCAVWEVLPNSVFRETVEVLGRLQPMIFPVMDNMTVRFEFFYVPARILWPGWESFYSGTEDEGGLVPACPYFSQEYSLSNGSIGDYMNLPSGDSITTGPKVNALPAFAFQKIRCDWYVNQNTMPDQAVFTPAIDGDNIAHVDFITGICPDRLYDMDYFTSAQPWPQKGEAVVIPLLGTSTDTFTPDALPVSLLSSPAGAPIFQHIDNTPAVDGSLSIDSSLGGTGILADSTPAALRFNPEGTLGITYADALAHAGTIEDLRLATKLQMFLEADGRSGTGSQYGANLQMHWGIYNHDSRIQRSEYIGSIKQRMAISEVLNTNGATVNNAPQGAMSGHGITARRHEGVFSYTCPEFGYVIAVASIIPDTSYYQGVPKMYSRFDRLDFPFPEFAELGEQPIQNQEIFYVPEDSGNTNVWGYVPRYTEMRMKYGTVAGDFKSSLDAWTMARKFSALPPLGFEFSTIQQNVALDRIFAVTDPTIDHVLFDVYFQTHVEQMLPYLVRPAL